jgi:hypothetical protein
MDAVRQIADAILYEGYVLWPYRRSALKNRQRWTFGGIYPRGHSEGREDDPWRMRTECLLLGDEDAGLDVSVRFLQVVRRQVMQASAKGFRPVDELTVAGERHLSWEEATERELSISGVRVSELVNWPRRLKIAIPPGQAHEDLHGESDLSEVDFSDALRPKGQPQPGAGDDSGARRPAGAIVRSWHRLDGCVEIGAARLPKGRGQLPASAAPARGLFRVTVRVANTTPWHGGSREQAVERTLCSAHAILRSERGEFASLTDPPEELRGAAEACRNDGVWPVLVGEPDDRSTVLASPIILEDHPRIAPESPGDLFDGGEIDQLLTLNILSLTDAEKAEMRASDPRAREILDRTEALSEEELMRLHGTIRDFRQVRS